MLFIPKYAGDKSEFIKKWNCWIFLTKPILFETGFFLIVLCLFFDVEVEKLIPTRNKIPIDDGIIMDLKLWRILLSTNRSLIFKDWIVVATPWTTKYLTFHTIDTCERNEISLELSFKQ